MSHPDLVQLFEYLEQPDSTRQSATLDHLSDCAHCRTRAARLAKLQTQVQRHIAQLRGGADARATQLQAELHHAVHGAVLRRDLSGTGAPHGSRASTGGDVFRRIADLFTLRFPVWIPATATAAVLIAVLGLPKLALDQTADGAPVAYQDASVMHFQSGADAQPGIGFFTGANRVERRFSGVEVTRPEPRTLALRWPLVDHAVEYRLSVSHVDGTARQHVATVVTTEPQARVVNFDFVAHSRYEWVIEGRTQDGTWFSATGGFVVP